jgi:fucose 4-O-acetylase-like acetyltransferase
MFDWTDRYMPVTVPNYDQIGTPAYYILMFFRLLMSFAGPAFFFISGYFIGVTAKGNQAKISWNMIFSRVKLLVVPFLIWTIIRYVLLRQFPRNINDILDPYHWIPLLIQFYLLAPVFVYLAKRNWKLLLLGLALIGMTLALMDYLAVFGNPAARTINQSLPNWVFLWVMPFWFPFGVVVGLYFTQFKAWLAPYRWHLLVAAVVVTILVLVEYQVVDRLTGPAWLGPAFGGFTKMPYSLSLILCFLAFDKSRMPVTEEISQLGTKSLGIYLGNIPFVYVVAVLMYRLVPALLGYQLIYFAILVLVGLGGPLLLMELVRRSPVRYQYRILFG